MRLWALLLLALSGCSVASVPSHAELRATTLRLEFVDGVCSATAIGPDLILSAKHCFGGKLKTINGQPATVVESHTESRDRIVVKVAGIRFKTWAKRGVMALQGDKLRFWGNPEGVEDVYREAVVARSYTDGLIFQAIVCGGDSGSGLFNAVGEVVAVVSAVTGDRVCKFGLSL